MPLRNVEPEWLEDTTMLGLLKNERVFNEHGTAYRVISSAGEKYHPVLARESGGFVTTHIEYPLRVFRDRRVVR